VNVDFRQKAQEAKQMNREEPLQKAEISGEDEGWNTRARTLIHTDESGTPLNTIKRSVDMTSASEYGPQSKNAIAVINQYFAREECSEIHFSGPAMLFAKVNGERVQIRAEFSTVEEYNRFIEDLICQADTQLKIDEIKSRARSVVRMAGGDRMAILMPPLTEHISAAIHKVVARTWNMNTIIENGTLTPPMAEFLQAAVRAKANVLVCGEMGAGKSTMLSLLVGQIAENERIALVEEVPEIFVDLPDVTRITYYPDGVTEAPMGLPEVIDTLLYMRMDRVIVGEIHDKGMYRMLRVMATGSDGSLSTFHAGTVSQALEQVKNHVLLEHPSLSDHVVAHFVRQAINLVIVLERVDGVHRVVEIAEVEWRTLSESSSVIGVNRLYKFNRKTGQFETEGRLDENGKLMEKSRKHGITMRPEWFAGSEFASRRSR
jgi:pilus assembly protein CpaF